MRWKLAVLALLGFVAAHTSAAAQDGRCNGCSAVVRANGSLRLFFDAKESKRIDEGRYRVVFGRSIVECTFSATIGSYGSGAEPAPPGFISVQYKSGNRVFINTYNASGAPKDRPFYLVVHCASD